MQLRAHQNLPQIQMVFVNVRRVQSQRKQELANAVTLPRLLYQIMLAHAILVFIK